MANRLETAICSNNMQPDGAESMRALTYQEESSRVVRMYLIEWCKQHQQVLGEIQSWSGLFASMPHLLLSDEFLLELKKSNLVHGRACVDSESPKPRVYPILATQKPTGIDDQIWSNSRFGPAQGAKTSKWIVMYFSKHS